MSVESERLFFLWVGFVAVNEFSVSRMLSDMDTKLIDKYEQ